MFDIYANPPKNEQEIADYLRCAIAGRRGADGSRVYVPQCGHSGGNSSRGASDCGTFEFPASRLECGTV